MADKVEWVRDYKEALAQAKSQGKFVLLDFYNPQ